MLGDTIFAVASPPGVGPRGIVRLSGPDALAVADELLDRGVPRERAMHERHIEVLGYPVDCTVLVMPGPRSYTGEDVVELHLPGAPLLLEHVLTRLRGAARDATPGEFTRRACEAGKMDLVEAEAVLELIHASGAESGRRALDILRGGLRGGIEEVRSALLDARAMLEAGLDFAEGETGVVSHDAWLPRLAEASSRLRELADALPAAAAGGELLLVGASNAGKSALCNALAGEQVALVSDRPGTTRDVLSVEIAPGVCVLDAPGDLAAARSADAAAIALRNRLATRAAGAVMVVDRTDPIVVPSELPVVAVVLTKLDLPADGDVSYELPAARSFSVSSTTGAGVAALRTFLSERSSAAPVGSGLRMIDLLERARQVVDRARAGAVAGVPEEVLAVDLLEAVTGLDQMTGRGSSDEVLDRVFSRFCLGK